MLQCLRTWSQSRKKFLMFLVTGNRTCLVIQEKNLESRIRVRQKSDKVMASFGSILMWKIIFLVLFYFSSSTLLDTYLISWGLWGFRASVLSFWAQRCWQCSLKWHYFDPSHCLCVCVCVCECEGGGAVQCDRQLPWPLQENVSVADQTWLVGIWI